jgi:hypothetical protein
MIENVKLTFGKQTLELDRVKTQNYVLDLVNLGDKDTNYTLVNSLDVIGVEMDIWYKKLSVVEITGWVLADDKDAESMERRKMRLNELIVPKRQITMLSDDSEQIDFNITESIRYGTSTAENNEVFCKFKITGLYRIV